MSAFDRLRDAFGSRTRGLLEPGELTAALRPAVDDRDGIRSLAEALGLDHHDESLQIEAAERRWRETNQ